MRAAVLLSVVIGAQAFVSAGDDGCARRYAIIETNEVVCKYFLLSMKEVQTRLNLTQAQIKSLESAMLAPPASNPGIAEVRRSQAQLLAAAATDEERSRIRRAGHEKASEITHLSWATTLQDTLSSTQRLALSELILQMTGPHAIVGNTDLQEKLHLTSDQIPKLKEIADSHDGMLAALRHRLLGLQIRPYRTRHDADVQSEMQCLVRVITEIEKDEDSEFLLVLGAEKCPLWTRMCGEPLVIQWQIDLLGNFPFKQAATP